MRIEGLYGNKWQCLNCYMKKYSLNITCSISLVIQVKLNAEYSLNRSTSCGGGNILGLLTLISIQEYEDLNNTKQLWRIITIIKV